MLAEFTHILRRQRSAIIGWGIGLLLYGMMMNSFFSNIQMMRPVQLDRRTKGYLSGLR